MSRFARDKHLVRFMSEISKHLTFLRKEDKRRVFERLVWAEEKFREELNQHPQSKMIYLKFITYIVRHNKNILTARPYFRVRAHTFNRLISPALKNVEIDKLKKFPINYRFVKFVYDNWTGTFPEHLNELKKIMEECRDELVKNDLPLAINRARIFFSKTPKSHLQFQDLIHLATLGLLNGIDKYVGKYSRNFNGVLIGRMLSSIMDEYNSSLIHFYPSDKNVIYSISAIKARTGVEDTTEAIKMYNKIRKQRGQKPLQEHDALRLMNATTPISDTMFAKDESSDKPLSGSLTDLLMNRSGIEDELEFRDLFIAVIKAIREHCGWAEKKLLVLMGLVLYEYLFEDWPPS